MSCIVAMLTYFSARFGVRFGLGDAGEVDIAVAVLAGGVGAAFGAVVSALRGGGSGEEVWRTICGVLGSALGAAVSSVVGGEGNGATVGTIVSAVFGCVVGGTFGVNLGGVCCVIGAVVCAIFGAAFGALLYAVAGGISYGVLGFVVSKILSAAGVSDDTSIFVSRVMLGLGVVAGAVGGAVLGLKAGYCRGVGVGAAVFSRAQKYVSYTRRMRRRVNQAVKKDKKSFQELQANINSLEECIVEFAVFCRKNIHSVLSSTLLQNEFWFLINILRKSLDLPLPQSEEFGAEPSVEVLRTTLPNLIQEEANIHFTHVTTFLERFQLYRSNLEVSKLSQELLECRNEEEIQTMIMNFIEAKFTETFTSQL